MKVATSPIKLKRQYIYYFIILMTFVIHQVNAGETNNVSSLNRNYAAANIGLCLMLNDGSKINSFSEIKNLSTACPSIQALNTTIKELSSKRGGESASDTSTDSSFLKKCMRRVNSDYTNWIEVIKETTNYNLFKAPTEDGKEVVFLEEWVTQAGSQNYLFNSSYKNIYEELNRSKEILTGDIGLIAEFTQRCEQAQTLEETIAVNRDWRQECGITNATEKSDTDKLSIKIGNAPENTSILLCKEGDNPPPPCLENIESGSYYPEAVDENNFPLKSTVYQSIQLAYQREANEVKKCIAAIAITKRRYSDGNTDDIGLLKTKPNVSTFNNSITCIDSGGEAIDYNRCASFVDQFNYTELLRVGEQTASELITKTAQLDAQVNTDPNDPAFILRQQLKVLEGEKNAATVAAWVLGVRAALLAGFATISWPSSDELVMECNTALDTLFPANGSDYCAKNQCILPYLHSDKQMQEHYQLNQKNQYACVEALGSMLILPNANAHTIAKGMAVQAAAEAAAKGAQAHFAGKNMDMLDNAIDNVDKATEAVETPDFFGDLKVGPCATNPESEECRSAGFNTGLDMVNPTINTGTTVRGTTTGELAEGENVNENTAVTGEDKPQDLASNISSSDFKKKIGNDSVRGPRAARIASGGKLAGSGGGGGGGGGGGASTGPAQGGGGGGAPPSTSAVGNTRKLRFSDNDSGKLSFSGGRGSAGSSRRRKAKGNPLAALMGKNKGGSKTQKYARGTASIGRKSGNIFDQISTRYSDVNGKKRLIEYEQK